MSHENATADSPQPEAIDQTDRPNEPRRRPGSRLLKLTLAAFGVLLGVAAVTFFVMYQKATAPVPEYEALLVEQPEIDLEAERKRLESEVTATYSEAQEEQEWQVRVSATELNAWLATRFAELMPELKEKVFRDPRVIIKEDRFVFAFRGRVGRSEGIVQVDVHPFASQGGELAMEIHSARVGTLDLPVEALLAQVEQSSLSKKVPVRITRSGEHPLVLVSLAELVGNRSKRLPRLSALELREGEMLIQGENLEVKAAIAKPTEG